MKNTPHQKKPNIDKNTNPTQQSLTEHTKTDEFSITFLPSINRVQEQFNCTPVPITPDLLTKFYLLASQSKDKNSNFYHYVIGINSDAHIDQVSQETRDSFKKMRNDYFSQWITVIDSVDIASETNSELIEVKNIVDSFKPNIAQDIRNSSEDHDPYRTFISALNEETTYSAIYQQRTRRDIPGAMFYIIPSKLSKESYSENRELATTRAYINCDPGKVTALVNYLISNIPNNFTSTAIKVLDYSLQELGENSKRDEKVIIYADDSEFLKIMELVKQFSSEHPEAFLDRSTPMLAMKVSDGVAIAHEPIQLTENPMSFNQIRAKLFDDIFCETVSFCMELESAEYTENQGPLLKTFSRCVYEEAKEDIEKHGVDFEEELNEYLSDENYKKQIIKLNLREMLKHIDQETFLKNAMLLSKRIAKELRINPENIALNL